MINADLMELLRCPQTLQTLAWAGPDVLAAANARISGGEGKRAADMLNAALVRADGNVLYPVCDDIPVLLAERAVSL